MRLVTPGAPEHPRSKLNLAADEIATVYQDTEHDRGIQLVFLDLGTPQAIDTVSTRDDEAAVIVDTETPDEVALLTDVYADVKNKLTARGIPAHEIRFVHEAKTREARFRLFQAANDGLARVIIGSTAKLGTGVNVQKRLAALHHLDAPWRPMDVEHFVVGSAWLTSASGNSSFRVTLSCVNGPGLSPLAEVVRSDTSLAGGERSQRHETGRPCARGNLDDDYHCHASGS